MRLPKYPNTNENKLTEETKKPINQRIKLVGKGKM